jgi:hypothetical protein
MAGLLGWAAMAHAQRQPVPVINFENIPVALSTSERLSGDQVRKAIVAAAAAKDWEVQEKAPGTFTASYQKGNKHLVTVAISYDSEKYSVRYLSSVNMKYQDVAPVSTNRFSPRVRDGHVPAPTNESTVQKHLDEYATLPETPYAKAAPKGVIHPFYEVWLRDLLGGVRAQLTIAAPVAR